MISSTVQKSPLKSGCLREGSSLVCDFRLTLFSSSRLESLPRSGSLRLGRYQHPITTSFHLAHDGSRSSVKRGTEHHTNRKSFDGRNGRLPNRKLPEASQILPDVGESPVHGFTDIRRIPDGLNDLCAHQNDGPAAHSRKLDSFFHVWFVTDLAAAEPCQNIFTIDDHIDR